MNSVVTLADSEVMFFIVALAGIGLIAIWVTVYNLSKLLQARARETTRREIAAYVAEGSIDPEHAAKLLATEASELERQIGTAIAWGTISPKKAESLLKAAREGKQEPAGVAEI